MSRPGTVRRYCALLALVALIAQTSIQIKAVAPLAVVTGEVLERLLVHPRSPVRVMLRGDVAELTRVASRLGITIERTLDQFVVVRAIAAQIALLQLEPAVKVIAGDLQVSPMMVVSDKAMGADQTRAGNGGALRMRLSRRDRQGRRRRGRRFRHRRAPRAGQQGRRRGQLRSRRPEPGRRVRARHAHRGHHRRSGRAGPRRDARPTKAASLPART